MHPKSYTCFQGYGFVEYSLPSSATKAKEALDVSFRLQMSELQVQQNKVKARVEHLIELWD